MDVIEEIEQPALPEPPEPIVAETLPPAEAWNSLSKIPVPLTVSIPLQTMSLQSILTLEPGQVLTTRWPTNQHVPLYAGDVFLATVDFERAGDSLGVRISGFQPSLT